MKNLLLQNLRQTNQKWSRISSSSSTLLPVHSRLSGKTDYQNGAPEKLQDLSVSKTIFLRWCVLMEWIHFQSRVRLEVFNSWVNKFLTILSCLSSWHFTESFRNKSLKKRRNTNTCGSLLFPKSAQEIPLPFRALLCINMCCDYLCVYIDVRLNAVNVLCLTISTYKIEISHSSAKHTHTFNIYQSRVCVSDDLKPVIRVSRRLVMRSFLL